MVKDMTRGPSLRIIMTFALSILVGSVCQYLYNVIDTLIVGRYIGTDALAAVGATGSISFLILGFASGVASGFGVVIGQFFGAKDEKKLRSCLANIIYTTLILMALMTAVSLFLLRDILTWMRTPEDIFGMSYSYLSVIFAGMTFTMFYNVLSAILRALGDTRTPLIVLIIAAVLNVIFDLIFVIPLNMGVAGAAYATILAQFLSAVLCLVYMVKKMPVVRIGREDLPFSFSMVGKLLGIGAPMGLQFSVTAIGTILLQAAINGHGTDVIAALTAVDKVGDMFWMVLDSVGVTMAFFCAQNLGAGKIDRIRRGERQALLINLVLGLLCCTSLFFFGENIATVFLGDVPEVMTYVHTYVRIKGVFFLALAGLTVWRNSIQGLGYSFAAVIGGLIELLARGAVTFLFADNLSMLYFAGPLAWVGADLFLVIAYFVIERRLVRRFGGKTAENG